MNKLLLCNCASIEYIISYEEEKERETEEMALQVELEWQANEDLRKRWITSEPKGDKVHGSQSATSGTEEDDLQDPSYFPSTGKFDYDEDFPVGDWSQGGYRTRSSLRGHVVSRGWGGDHDSVMSTPIPTPYDLHGLSQWLVATRPSRSGRDKSQRGKGK